MIRVNKISKKRQEPVVPRPDRGIQKKHELFHPAHKARRNPGRKWLLYILKCADRSLYTGITNNLDRRIKLHDQGKAARYTRTRLPVKIVYQEPCKSRSSALVREYRVKSLSRRQKLAMIAAHS